MVHLCCLPSHAPEFNDESIYRDADRVKDERKEKAIETMGPPRAVRTKGKWS